MKEDLSNFRKVYNKSQINFNDLKDPFVLFERWFKIAKNDNAKSLKKKILRQEHILYPNSLNKFIN